MEEGLMEHHYQQILSMLLNYEYISTQELAVMLRKTNRTVRTYLKELNDVLTKHGAIISTVYKKGNHLDVYDDEQFMMYISQLQLDTTNYNIQENRIIEIFSCLFFKYEYIKQEELTDIMFISIKQLKEDLKVIKKVLQQYHLTLENKPYHGMFIEGAEYQKRLCMLDIYFTYSESFFTQHILQFDALFDSIHNIIYSSIINQSYHITDDHLNQFVLNVILAIHRYQHHHYLEQIEVPMHHNAIELIAMNITSLIQKILNISLDQQETNYMMIELLGKENKILENNQNISESIEHLALSMIQNIKKYFGITLMNDFDLIMSLCLHLEPLLSRIRYRSFLHNPLTQDIKANLCQSYEMAIVACEILNEKYHVILPEDEIAFIALYIDLAYENNTDHMHKKRILFVCSNSVGTVKFLKAKFTKMFGQFIEQLDVINTIDLENYQLDLYDLIFTTVSLNLKIHKPVIKIENIMDEKDIDKMETHLANSFDIEKYIKKDYFFNKLDCQDKEQCLKHIIHDINQKEPLPEQFEEMVFKREALGSTEFGNVIALPHPLYPITNHSFISISILKKAILWNNHKIRIVILMSVSQQQNIIEIDNIYHIISTILSHKVLQNQMIHASTYEEILACIRGLL